MTRQIADDVLQAVKEDFDLQECVEYSGRKSYKIPVSAFSKFPDSLSTELKSLKKLSTSTTFGGKKGQRVRSSILN